MAACVRLRCDTLGDNVTVTVPHCNTELNTQTKSHNSHRVWVLGRKCSLAEDFT